VNRFFAYITVPAVYAKLPRFVNRVVKMTALPERPGAVAGVISARFCFGPVFDRNSGLTPLIWRGFSSSGVGNRNADWHITLVKCIPGILAEREG
jgi:hypothetical protein